MRLLGVSRTAARQQLLRLREAGVLVRVGERYYPAGAVTPPEELLAVIQTYLGNTAAAAVRIFSGC